MPENKMIDLCTVIGVYSISNTCTILVHKIDYGEDKVLASINGTNPEWCDFTEETTDGTDELELGFRLGAFFVPFSEVMRFCS